MGWSEIKIPLETKKHISDGFNEIPRMSNTLLSGKPNVKHSAKVTAEAINQGSGISFS